MLLPVALVLLILQQQPPMHQVHVLHSLARRQLLLPVELKPHECAPHLLARPQVVVDDLLHARVLRSLARPQQAETWAVTWTFRG